VAVSSSACVGLDGAITYLLEYPFGCLEQRMSRVLPILEVSQLVGALDIKGFPKDKLHSAVVKEIENLPSFQREDGGFGLWPDKSEYSSDYLTSYTLEVLAKARELGYSVDQQVIDKAKAYLVLVINESTRQTYPYSKDETLVNQAYALYALSLWGRFDQAAQSNLFAARSKMPLLAKVYLLAASRRQAASNGIDRTGIIAELEKDWPVRPGSKLRRSISPRAKARALLGLLQPDQHYRQHPEGAPRQPEGLCDGSQDCALADGSPPALGPLGDTHTDAVVIEALNRYVMRYERNTPDFQLVASLGDKPVLKQSFKGRDLSVHNYKAEVGETSAPLKFEKTGTGRFYYDASMTYAVSGDQPPKTRGWPSSSWFPRRLRASRLAVPVPGWR